MTAIPTRAGHARERPACEQCGYSLVGLESPLCPECGTPISPPATAGPLGHKAAVGFMLMSGQSVLTRILAFGSQIVLARVLLKAEFGLFGLAAAVLTYANLAQQVGVREVLLSRQKRLELWSNAGFWVAAATALLSMVAIAVAAPIAAWYYGEPKLLWMLLILALSQPLYSLSLVQEAKVQSRLRFRYMAAVQFVWGALQSVFQVFFALLGFGAFSLVLPRLLAGLTRCTMLWRAEPITIRRNPQLSKWKYILGPGVMLLLTGVANTLAFSLPMLVIGGKAGLGPAGDLGFAYNLSIQAVMLMSSQLDNVLFPTLGKMAGEPERQRGALVRSARALTAVMAPFCLFQIVAARPLVMLVFGDKWESAIPALQIMSAGMMLGEGFAPAQSLIQAQGRFKTRLFLAMLWGVIAAGLSITGILVLRPEHAAIAASCGLAIGYFGYGLHGCVAATKPLGGGIGDALRVIAMPSVVGALAAAGAWGAGTLLPSWPEHPQLAYVAQIATIGLVGLVSYVLLLRVLTPSLWEDLHRTGAPILRRLRALAGKQDPPADQGASTGAAAHG